MMNSALFFWIITTILSSTRFLVNARGPDCCSGIINEACRETCQKLRVNDSSMAQWQVLLTAAESCPASLTEFWTCIDRTLPAAQIVDGQETGTMCCDLARTKACRNRCETSTTTPALLLDCSTDNDGKDFFECLKDELENKQCCGQARMTSCGLICRAIHIAGVTDQRTTRDVLSNHCRQNDRPVEQCVNRMLNPRPTKIRIILPCCNHGHNELCRTTCRTLLQADVPESHRLEELSKVCSTPQFTDPFWQCFLSNSNKKTHNSSIPVASVDNAKLQCCSEATSGRCRKLCAQTYKKGHMSDFYASCSYISPVSSVEENMHHCLTDVDQPCKLGCSGMQFCSHFNHRPAEMFRSCNSQADLAAAKRFEQWKNGLISIHHFQIAVKDITKCQPYMWKAVACSLEIKPCSPKPSLISLCKEDCIYLLSQCADQATQSRENSVYLVCEALQSRDSGSCVSLEPYARKSPYALSAHSVIQPCEPNPCMEGEICLIRKRKCKHHVKCLPYVCHAACSLGGGSSLVVPKGTAVRLADTNSNMAGDRTCFLTCQCSQGGKIDGCQHLYCLNRRSCKSGLKTIAHGSVMTSSHGRHCVCHSGQMVCSITSCQSEAYSPLYTAMPGHCPLKYSPVCADNGKTYPNNCIAACVERKQIVAYGIACRQTDPCSHKPCSAGELCVPRPQVCLNEIRCPQFECVSEIEECSPHHHDPVCGNNGEEFNNMCILLSRHHSLAYRGHCQSSCSVTGVVCGHDGETYDSECAARAARITVDYVGKCEAFGKLTRKSKPMSCSRIQCPPVVPAECQGIIPNGGCCPICAAKIVFLWSPKMLKAAVEHTKNGIITTDDVLKALSAHISILHCEAYGYLSVNSELIAIIAPTSYHHNRVQVEACLSEAKRLHNLINARSPSIVSHMTLTPFILASMEVSTMSLPVYRGSTDRSTSDKGSSSPSAKDSVHKNIFSRPTLWLLVLTVSLMHRKWVLRL